MTDSFSDEISLADLFSAIFRRWRLVASITVVVTTSALLHVWRQPQQYAAEVSVAGSDYPVVFDPQQPSANQLVLLGQSREFRRTVSAGLARAGLSRSETAGQSFRWTEDERGLRIGIVLASSNGAAQAARLWRDSFCKAAATCRARSALHDEWHRAASLTRQIHIGQDQLQRLESLGEPAFTNKIVDLRAALIGWQQEQRFSSNACARLRSVVDGEPMPEKGDNPDGGTWDYVDGLLRQGADTLCGDPVVTEVPRRTRTTVAVVFVTGLVFAAAVAVITDWIRPRPPVSPTPVAPDTP